LQGEVENKLLAMEKTSEGKFKVCVAKPGLILEEGKPLRAVMAAVMNLVGIVPNVPLKDLCAAMLDQVINGFEKEPLQNDDLHRIGQNILSTAT